jgi:5,10-methylene-tetrahydrofolate dehydrogenase/methenyl tetrahydrofolate cyclohydrolase
MILSGKKISEKIKEELKEEIESLKNKNIIPGLGIIMVGKREDSQTYVSMKVKACKELGIQNYDVILDEGVNEETIINEIEKMNNNENIHGILIQLPLPNHINKQIILNSIKLNKDVDGFHIENMGKLALKQIHNYVIPCTPEGCIELLDRYNIELSGKRVVILGRSNIVGLPLSLLFLHRDSTVTICHSKTRNLKCITREADILVSACSKMEFITKEYIKKDCIILDVGIHRKEDITKRRGYKLVGDVNFSDVENHCFAITPVPGGIGPMTIAILLKHTVELAKNNSK